MDEWMLNTTEIFKIIVNHLRKHYLILLPEPRLSLSSYFFSFSFVSILVWCKLVNKPQNLKIIFSYQKSNSFFSEANPEFQHCSSTLVQNVKMYSPLIFLNLSSSFHLVKATLLVSQ